MATALPNLRLDAETLGEIRQALNSGKEVITHTDPISVPGWQGAGYVITHTDVETGAGAWKIGGGLNGGWESIPQDIAELLVYLANGDGLSKSFRFLANFAGTAFSAVGDFIEILNMEGCGVGDAVGGALINMWIASYLTNLSFMLVAAIVNPIVLVVSIMVIIYAIRMVTEMIKSGVEYICRNR